MKLALFATAMVFAIAGVVFDLLVGLTLDGWWLLVSCAGGFAAIQAMRDWRRMLRKRAIIVAILAGFLLLPGAFALFMMIRGFGPPV